MKTNVSNTCSAIFSRCSDMSILNIAVSWRSCDKVSIAKLIVQQCLTKLLSEFSVRHLSICAVVEVLERRISVCIYHRHQPSEKREVRAAFGFQTVFPSQFPSPNLEMVISIDASVIFVPFVDNFRLRNFTASGRYPRFGSLL